MFDIGQNDLAGAFYSKTLDQVLASIPKILEEFETGLKVSSVGFEKGQNCSTLICLHSLFDHMKIVKI